MDYHPELFRFDYCGNECPRCKEKSDLRANPTDFGRRCFTCGLTEGMLKTCQNRRWAMKKILEDSQ